MSEKFSRNRRAIMTWMLVFSSLLMALKFLAWRLTHSNAILTDALESIVNVAAGGFALFSVIYADRPRDENHPYGHGKIEFVSAGFEGALILLAGGLIVAKAIYGFYHPQPLERIDTGVWLTAAAGLCNLFMGLYLVRRGKLLHSVLMTADGKHLLTDTISSGGLVVGLIILHVTNIAWMDNALAIAFGAYIVFTGMALVREALGNLLDEADTERLTQLVDILNRNRRPNWIDIHNLRVLKYGTQLHVDAHLTLPWYLTLEEAHNEVSAVEQLVKSEFDRDIEFFIHADPCLPTSCPICSVHDCPKRQSPQVKQLDWTLQNTLPDKKHQLE